MSDHRTQQTRRRFLENASLISLAPTIPFFLTNIGKAEAAAKKDPERVLVVIQLNGGNDGINTVVPFRDEGYAKHRKELRIPEAQLLKVSESAALHPAMQGAADLLEDGRLAIVQGVGYPNPNRSHEVSMSIYQTARFDPTEHENSGWLGRAMDQRTVQQVAAAGRTNCVLLGDENPPVALRGRRSSALALAHLKDLTLSGEQAALNGDDPAKDDLLAFTRRATAEAFAAAKTIDEITTRSAKNSDYPATKLGQRMQSIGQLIKSDFGASVYYAIQSGYDTHAAQLPSHARLLTEFSRALKAFDTDMKGEGFGDKVVTLCFSEFGRRVQENGSLGTDHGTAGPMFLSGAVQPGLVGAVPSMTDLEDDDLKRQFDFRQVYATLISDWLGYSAKTALDGNFEKLKLTM
jgi:uncharacterized protein (DUF1501 family)